MNYSIEVKVGPERRIDVGNITVTVRIEDLPLDRLFFFDGFRDRVVEAIAPYLKFNPGIDVYDLLQLNKSEKNPDKK